MKIFNTEEVLEISELHWQDDTLVIPMHIFDTEIRTVVESGRMNGSGLKVMGMLMRFPNRKKLPLLI